MRALSSLLVVLTLAFSGGACANAELEEKVRTLEDKNAALEKDLKAAEQAKRNLQQKLAQAAAAPPRESDASLRLWALRSCTCCRFLSCACLFP